MIRKIKGDTMANVQTELARILRDIREKTGVQIRLAPGKGEETVFSLEYGGERMTAYLDGTGKEAERTAKLAAYLVSGADARALFPDEIEVLLRRIAMCDPTPEGRKHILADDLLVRLLRQLSYDAICNAYETVGKRFS